MAMAMWRKKETAGASGNAPACVVRSAGEGGGKIPKGYVPMVLVGDAGEREERVLVHVGMLTEPRVLALLEMSAQRFGYGQPGVLRIPCGVERFEQTVRGHRREMQDSACAAAH
ncbi:auxin-responsive protein SAUR71-like [Triticum dicoccoides]|uniref:auxin-responsive protein SAUR71-like n=1 Tax=Triticum dicoccoides TaxID=85692 RepID=UPI00188ED311|nr:auxin-responsive protein SAUR71-like [Triticum dicoccoides]